MALALVMLIGSSRFAARWLESHSGTRIGRILRRTRPQRMPRRA